MARIPFDPEKKARWGWWWNPDIDQDMQLEEMDLRPEWTDDEPWNYDLVCAWYRDQELAEPQRPGSPVAEPSPAVAQPKPEPKPASEGRRARPGANVTDGTVRETRDAGRRKRRMKRYMKWWHAKQAAIAQGLPEPARPVGGFGDPPGWEPSQEGDDDTVR